MSQKLRYGVLSTAQIALNKHIPASKEINNAEIVAISSRDKKKAQDAAQKHDISKAYGTYDELIADPNIDAIINPLPNGLHCEWTIKAAESGKHILCEKPLAATPEECQRMIDAANANNVLLYEGFTQHFNPIMSTMHQLISNGTIGDITLIRSELTYTIQDWENDVRVDKDLAGGALMDAGCYCVNTVRALMQSEPESVTATEKIHPKRGVDALFTGLLKFPKDRIAYIATGMEQPFRFTVEVIGTKGSFYTPNLFNGTDLTLSANGKTETQKFDLVNRFALQLEHFSNCVLNGTPLRVSPQDGKNNVAVLTALKQSAQQGQAIQL